MSAPTICRDKVGAVRLCLCRRRRVPLNDLDVCRAAAQIDRQPGDVRRAAQHIQVDAAAVDRGRKRADAHALVGKQLTDVFPAEAGEPLYVDFPHKKRRRINCGKEQEQPRPHADPMAIAPPEDGHAVPHADAEIATAARRKIHQLRFVGKQHPDTHGRLPLADAAQADAASVAEIEQGAKVARIDFPNGITKQQIQ